MDCKEAEKAIAGFVENKLKDDTMEAFIAHTRTCPDCMEELSIQYLVAVGMSRLEEGGTFDLGGEKAVCLCDEERVCFEFSGNSCDMLFK